MAASLAEALFLLSMGSVGVPIPMPRRSAWVGTVVQ